MGRASIGPFALDSRAFALPDPRGHSFSLTEERHAGTLEELSGG